MRVFLSHTSELSEYPRGDSFVAAAKRAVERAGHVSVEMGTWTADPRPPRQVCIEAVTSCDVYAVIVGFRWGSPVPDDAAGRSYTEVEFDTAADLPRLVFCVAEEPAVVLPRRFFIDEQAGNRQAGFRARINASGLTRAEISTPSELETLLYQALVELSERLLAAASNTSPVRTKPVWDEWRAPVVSVPPLTGLEVARRDLVGAIVDALTTPRKFSNGEHAGSPAGPVGLMTRVTGATGGGGFGKTTLARVVVHDRRIRDYFTDGVVWVTVGEGARGPLLAEKLNEVVARLTGQRPALTDPLTAGSTLADALAGRRFMLVVDDVWSSTQLQPFLQLIQSPADGAGNSHQSAIGLSSEMLLGLLVTTRRASVLPESCSKVVVNEMTQGESVQLLTRGLTNVPSDVVNRVLRLTGRWPVLLGLINGSARADVQLGAQAGQTIAALADQIAADGPDVLDLAEAADRNRAVSATLRTSLDRLNSDEQARYAELAVFGDNVDIPRAVLELYWAHTASWTPHQVHHFCRLLLDLGLASEYRLDGSNPRLRLHDVIRVWLRYRTVVGLATLAKELVDAHRGLIPSDPNAPDASTRWWRLPAAEKDHAAAYLWAWLPRHLAAAGLADELVGVLLAPEWMLGKIEGLGPAAVEADLLLPDDRACYALAQVIRQDGHLLGKLDPPGSLAATLASRCTNDVGLGSVKAALLNTIGGVHLEHAGNAPDRPHPNLRRVLSGHNGSVIGLVVAPDGSWLASGGSDGTVRVWDPVAGLQLHTLTGHSGWVSQLVVAPDGSWLASGGSDGTVRVWDPVVGVELHSLTGHTAVVQELVAAPDGSWLASGGDDGTVRIWDPIAGAQLHTLTGHTWVVDHLVVAPDESWLASGGHDGTVRVWDPIAGAQLHTLAGHRGWVDQLVVAPNGSWLASGGDDGTVRIWDPVAGVQLHTLIGHTDRVTQLVIAPNGSWLASGGGGLYGAGDGTVRVWDPAAGIELHTLTGHSGWVSQLVVAPDGSWLASGGGDGTVRVWDPVSGIQSHTLTGHTSLVNELAVAPDGSWLASGGWDRTVRVWDPVSGVQLHTLTGHGDRVDKLVVAPDGSWLASASGGLYGGEGTVRVWDPVAGAGSHTRSGHTAVVDHLVVAPDGSWLASASEDGTVRVWDPVAGVELHTLTGHSGGIARLMLSPDGSWLASASWDGTVRVWDPVAGAELHTLTGHSGSVNELMVAPDGSWLASGGRPHGGDGTVRVWDPVAGVELHTLPGHSDWDYQLVVSPDGSWLASAGRDGTIRVWDPIAGAEINTLTGHGDAIDQLVVAPDGSWLAYASRDRTIRVWDPVAGVELHALSGHTDLVGWVVVAPDGSWLASGGGDRTFRVWDPVAGTELRTLTGHIGGITPLMVAPDGSWLASASLDGTVRLWDPIAGVELRTLTGHRGWVDQLVLSPDGLWLASAGRDRSIRVWDPFDGSPVAALRTGTALKQLTWTEGGLAGSGDRFVYMLRIVQTV